MLNKNILMAPRPGLSGGPSISLLRLEQAFKKQGYSTSSLAFRLMGRQILPWDFSVMMGVPAHAFKLLSYPQPTILIIGKPEDPVESAATGRLFTLRDEVENEERAKVIERADYVTFISNYVQEIWMKWFLERGRVFPDARRCEVIYHGLNLNVFKPKLRPPNKEIFTIGCVGALRTPVRVNAIFEVSRRLPFRHQFLVVGSATESCESILRECENNPDFRASIKRINWVNADDLPAQLHQMDCLLHPVDHEGFGIAISEAMACGVPIVAPGHGAASEIIMGGGVVVNVEQFKYNNHFYDELANGVIEVRDDLLNYAYKARAVAERSFDIKKIAERYIKIGNSLIDI